MPRKVALTSSSPQETIAFGEKLAASLGPGSVVALEGGLGAGKTCLTKGIARGLGVLETVTSPTYTIVSEYEAAFNGKPLPFYHIDAYRLQGDDDFDAIGGSELFSAEAITVVEWSQLLPASIPPSALRVHLEVLDDGRRRILVETPA
jgi:tRNA threonylcarbamoyladenosine biosynthesis protein TsaE